MYNKLQLLFKYIKFYFIASNGKGHGMHSPFVFDFITKVLNDKAFYESYKNIESIDSLLNQQKYNRLLFRIIKYYQPINIVEIGTEQGITTAYLANAKPDARITTLEICTYNSKLIKENFNHLKLKNIELIKGDINLTLNNTISQIKLLDFALINSSSNYNQTLYIFSLILKSSNNNTIIVLNNINKNSAAEKTWNTIINVPEVTTSIDLFNMGIVFLKKEFKAKQNFKIRF